MLSTGIFIWVDKCLKLSFSDLICTFTRAIALVTFSASAWNLICTSFCNIGAPGGFYFGLIYSGRDIELRSQIFKSARVALFGASLGIVPSIRADAAQWPFAFTKFLSKSCEHAKNPSIIVRDLGFDLLPLSKVIPTESRQGAIVTYVQPIGSAINSGIKTGDIISKIAGIRIDDSKQIHMALLRLRQMRNIPIVLTHKATRVTVKMRMNSDREQWPFLVDRFRTISFVGRTAKHTSKTRVREHVTLISKVRKLSLAVSYKLNISLASCRHGIAFDQAYTPDGISIPISEFNDNHEFGFNYLSIRLPSQVLLNHVAGLTILLMDKVGHSIRVPVSGLQIVNQLNAIHFGLLLMKASAPTKGVDLGLDLMPTSKFLLDPSIHGLLVTNRPNFVRPAGWAGVRRGDVITKIDGTKVETLKQYHSVVQTLVSKKGASFDLVRKGKHLHIKFGFLPGLE